MQEKYINAAREVINFIDKSPTAFQAAANIAAELEASGYVRLSEAEKWDIKPGGKYYVRRNMSSVIAICLPNNPQIRGFMMIASHSDSPCLKIKPNPEITVGGEYVKLNVEKYGGMICSTWFDRPLSIAGRVVLNTDNGIKTMLVDFDKNIAIIPSLAIHLGSNKDSGCNVQKDMLPLICGGDNAAFSKLLKEAVGADISDDDILGADLFLYNNEGGAVIGADNEFFSAPRIDDMECAYISLKAFIESQPTDCAKVCCIFDNEEVGSGTKQGAKSDFLYNTIYRIADAVGMSKTDFMQSLASSFMLSADNGHALHPNYEEKACPTNRPVLNGGVVIKYNAQQKYTTDAVSEAIFKKICNSAHIPYQEYANRSDIPGGSTLGNLSGEHISINTVDIGIAQLAMHSCYETAGVKDVVYMKDAMRRFYETELTAASDGIFNTKL